MVVVVVVAGVSTSLPDYIPDVTSQGPGERVGGLARPTTVSVCIKEYYQSGGEREREVT